MPSQSFAAAAGGPRSSRPRSRQPLFFLSQDEPFGLVAEQHGLAPLVIFGDQLGVLLLEMGGCLGLLPLVLAASRGDARLLARGNLGFLRSAPSGQPFQVGDQAVLMLGGDVQLVFHGQSCLPIGP